MDKLLQQWARFAFPCYFATELLTVLMNLLTFYFKIKHFLIIHLKTVNPLLGTCTFANDAMYNNLMLAYISRPLSAHQ